MTRLDVAPTSGPATSASIRVAAAGTFVSTGAAAPLAPRVHDEPLTRDQVRDLRKRIRAVDHAVRDVVEDREHDRQATTTSSERGNVREIRHLAREFRHDLRVLARTARHAEHVLSALNGSLQRFVKGAGAVAGSGTETEPTPVHDEPLPLHDEPQPTSPPAPAGQKDIDPQIVKIANSVFELLKFVKQTLLPQEPSPSAPSSSQSVATRAPSAFQVPPVAEAPETPETPPGLTRAPTAFQVPPVANAPTAPEQSEVDPRLQKIANSVFELLKFVKQTLLPNEGQTEQPVAASASFTRITAHVDLLA